MRSSVVVFFNPLLSESSKLIKFEEKVCIKDRFSVDSIKSLDRSILNRSASLKKLYLNLTLFSKSSRSFHVNSGPLSVLITLGFIISRITLYRVMMILLDEIRICHFLLPVLNEYNHR